ncbi:MAG TPA: hypothetical protein VK184_25655 [Nostocaceae cyanobacterium]|nr:hypothetical protein [Nostocaceae cyanobacterium]
MSNIQNYESRAKKTLNDKRRNAQLKLLGLVGSGLTLYSGAGIVHDGVPFPGSGWLGRPPVETVRINPHYVSGQNSSSNLPQLNRDIESADATQIEFAKQLAGSDGRIDATERDSACLVAQSQGSKQVDALNEVFIKVQQKKIRVVSMRTSMNGCTQVVH